MGTCVVDGAFVSGSEGVQAGDAFLNDRVRSVLASEFHVTDRRKLRSRATPAVEALSWWNDDTASEVRILDARTDWDGSERTGTAAALVDLGVEPHTTREH